MTTAKTAPSPILLILAEFAGAMLGGVLLGLLCVVGVALILANSNLGMGVLTVQVYGGIIGFAIGTGVGAALGGRIVGRPGNWGLAALASVITGILVAVVMRLFALGDLLTTLGVAVLLMLVAAVIGSHLRRPSQSF